MLETVQIITLKRLYWNLRFFSGNIISFSYVSTGCDLIFESLTLISIYNL
jgi:hypothetical protein